MKSMMRHIAIVPMACLLASCASTGTLVTSPGVSLRNVEAVDLGFSSQTFRLAFDVTNPNSFPLPVNHVDYSVELDGYRFATGRTPGEFTIPAAGDGQFEISVELDLLKTAPQLLYVVKEAVDRPIAYELEGEFGLALPMAPPVRFRTAGVVRFEEIRRQALNAR